MDKYAFPPLTSNPPIYQEVLRQPVGVVGSDTQDRNVTISVGMDDINKLSIPVF